MVTHCWALPLGRGILPGGLLGTGCPGGRGARWALLSLLAALLLELLLLCLQAARISPPVQKLMCKLISLSCQEA